MVSQNALAITTYVLKIILFILALFISSMIIGHFIAHFSVGKIKIFKYGICTTSCFIGIISFLLIYTDILPIVVLVTILTSFRWAKYVIQSYPFIGSVKSLVDFGTSLFLSVCSILLWFIFEIFNFDTLTLLKFGEFYFSAMLIPLTIIFTICFNDKKTIKNEEDEIIEDEKNMLKNGILRNYYIEFSNNFINKYIKKQEGKSKKD